MCKKCSLFHPVSLSSFISIASPASRLEVEAKDERAHDVFAAFDNDGSGAPWRQQVAVASSRNCCHIGSVALDDPRI